jgi:hypothetical protein
MPGGEPTEGATAAHGARGSQLPESAAESAWARLPRTESAAENAAESALAPIEDLELLEGDLENRRLPAEIVRERLRSFPKEARLPLIAVSRRHGFSGDRSSTREARSSCARICKSAAWNRRARRRS